MPESKQNYHTVRHAMSQRKNSMPGRYLSAIGSYRTTKTSLIAGLLLAQLIVSQPSIAEDKVELRPVPEDAPAVVAPIVVAPIPVIPSKPKSEHPILDCLRFPIEHPIQFSEKCVYPVVHPVAATLVAFDGFCKLGKWSEKRGLTAGLSLCGALGNVATPAVVGLFR